jgi:hypothetical protein
MILFRPEHVAPILEGRKTQTRRFGKRRWNIGAIHQCRTRMLDAESTFARVRILDVTQQCLGSMTTEDARAEGYDNVGAFIDEWESINGANCWAPRLTVWVVTFEVAP